MDQITQEQQEAFAQRAGLALYRKFGFEEEGTHRAHTFREGTYVDTIAMARLRVTGR